MITKCANPECSQPFRVFRGGKLFIVEVGLNRQSANPNSTGRAQRKLEHFWLCKQCATTMTLVVEQGRTPAVMSTCEELRSVDS